MTIRDDIRSAMPRFDASFPNLDRSPVLGGSLSIYVLVGDGRVGYVGASTCPASREVKHRKSRTNSALDRWKASCTKWRMVVVDSGTVAEWGYLEDGWIGYYSGLGTILNVRRGGPNSDRDLLRIAKLAVAKETRRVNARKAKQKRANRQGSPRRTALREHLAKFA